MPSAVSDGRAGAEPRPSRGRLVTVRV